MKTSFLGQLFTLVAMAATIGLFGQQSSEKSNKEIIIIEKTVDENGNEIARSITRKNSDELSDEELKNLLESGSLPQARDPQDFWKRFNWSFGDGWDRDARPTLGLSLRFEGDQAIVSEVMTGSDAEEEDIRTGDLLVSINRFPISNFDDVKEALDGKKVGDEVDVLVFRDGTELEKRIELRVNRFGEMGFTFPDNWGSDGFFFDLDNKGDLRIFTDSLLNRFDFENLMPELRTWKNTERDPDIDSNEKGQLGVFIEDGPNGVLITDVIEGSPADKAGLEVGDIIRRMNDEVVTSYRELVMVMERKVKGEKLTVEIERNKSIKEIEVVLN